MREVRIDGGGGAPGGQGRAGGAGALLRGVLLPAAQALPPDYVAFQVWDAAQGLCSYVRGMLVQVALLEGLGVGRAGSTAAAAALQSFWKDASGQVTGVAFATCGAPAFDVRPKQFRFLADCLNNVGLLCSLLAPRLAGAGLFLPLACAGSACAAACGVAAGASRAAFGQHFARGGAGIGLADLQAKEGVQETAVSLLGATLGTLVLHIAGNSLLLHWAVFAALTFAHLFFNARAVRSLSLATLNQSRLDLALRGYIDSKGKAPSPADVAAQEDLLPPLVARFLDWDPEPCIFLGARLESLRRASGGGVIELARRSSGPFLCRASSGDILVGLFDSNTPAPPAAETFWAFCLAAAARHYLRSNEWSQAERDALEWVESEQRTGDFEAALRRAGWLVDDVMSGAERALEAGPWRLHPGRNEQER